MKQHQDLGLLSSNWRKDQRNLGGPSAQGNRGFHPPSLETKQFSTLRVQQ